jgi:hypothetical protein
MCGDNEDVNKIMMMFGVLALCRFIPTFWSNILSPSSALRWRQYVSLKYWHLTTNLHSAKPQNTIIIIIALNSVKT